MLLLGSRLPFFGFAVGDSLWPEFVRADEDAEDLDDVHHGVGVDAHDRFCWMGVLRDWLD